jgi:hypothetical protein
LLTIRAVKFKEYICHKLLLDKGNLKANVKKILSQKYLIGLKIFLNCISLGLVKNVKAGLFLFLGKYLILFPILRHYDQELIKDNGGELALTILKFSKIGYYDYVLIVF